MFSLNVCLTCEAFLFKNQTLCDFCLDRFSNRVTNHGLIIRKKPIFIQSLWSWDRESEEISRALVYGMKGCGDEKKWQWIATLMMSSVLPIDRRSCLVPVPSKSGEADHAFGLTLALSQLTGLPIENCLQVEKIEYGHQRTRNRVERRQTAFVKARRLRKKYAHFIVVDDVVTSGATLQAAFLALNEPDSIQGLCFIDRRLVAEYDEPCYKQRQ